MSGKSENPPRRNDPGNISQKKTRAGTVCADTGYCSLPLFADGFDESAEILSCPHHRYGIQGIGFLLGPGDHLVDVLILDYIELVGQAHFFVGFLERTVKIVRKKKKKVQPFQIFA